MNIPNYFNSECILHFIGSYFVFIRQLTWTDLIKVKNLEVMCNSFTNTLQYVKRNIDWVINITIVSSTSGEDSMESLVSISEPQVHNFKQEDPQIQFFCCLLRFQEKYLIFSHWNLNRNNNKKFSFKMRIWRFQIFDWVFYTEIEDILSLLLKL